MNYAAFSGLAADVIATLEPHTEADRAGLLVSFLVAFGASVGAGPHAIADGAEHPARLNAVLVGRSARARKGTSWAVIRRLFEQAVPEFTRHRVVAGLASGEGLVADLADRPEGIDRSVLVQEAEFARLLRVASRSATLSALLRNAWDGGELSIITRKEPLRAVGANVGLLGHVTAEELRQRLNQVEIANGFANRILFAWVERSKRLPAGGAVPIEQLEALGVRLRHAIFDARELGVLRRSSDAEARWAEIYNGLDDDVTGVVGSLTARAEAQMLRLSVAYALLDGSPVIEVHHLEAAEAVWQYCEASVVRLFTGVEADGVVTRLLAALQIAGTHGLDGTAQRDLFSRHLPGTRLAHARWELERRGLAQTTTEETGGRPRLITYLATTGLDPAVSSLPSQIWSPDSSPPTSSTNPEILTSEKRRFSEADEQ